MHEVGDVALLDFTVTNSAATLVDATVVLTVAPPSGTAVTPTVTHASLGRYTAEFTPTLAGRHVIRWSATGAASKSKVDVLNVASAVDPVGILSLAEAREHLNIPADDDVEDDEIRTFIAAASLVVERHTGQTVARRTFVEDHFAHGGGVILRRAPVVSLTTLASPDGTTTWVPGDMALDGFSGVVTGGLTGPVRVTYVAGMSQVPEDWITATQIICAHLWQTQRASSFTSGPSFNSDTPAAVVGMGYALPNRAAQLLGGRAPNTP